MRNLGAPPSNASDLSSKGYVDTAIAGITSVAAVSTTTTLAAVAGKQYIYLLQSGAVPTLPTAVGNTSVYQIKNTYSSSINLATTSSQTIEAAAGPLIIYPNEAYTLVSDNANWWII